VLVGRPPFDDTSMGELIRRIATEPAPDLAALRPDLPPLLSGVVARLLAKAPHARQADGRRVALELRTCARTLAPSQGTIAP
jgi:eukaryotic-like serine/threonine-protein kinase